MPNGFIDQRMSFFNKSHNDLLKIGDMTLFNFCGESTFRL